MRTLLLFASTLLISLSALAANKESNDKKVKESQPVAPVELVQTLQLTGSVVDEKNQETLAGAAIVVDGKKYYSNLDGNFSIDGVKPGQYTVVVELISYEPVKIDLDLTGNREIKVGLTQK